MGGMHHWHQRTRTPNARTCTVDKSTWTKMTLGDVIELKRGYDLPERGREDGPYPIVSSSGISGRHSKAMAKAPGVVTGRYGTLGVFHYITEDYWPLNTALYVRDFKGNDPRFISYFLRTIDFFAYSDKAAVPGLNRNHLHMAPVTIPDPDTQRAIAGVLGALDDKIEQNRRMARTLEAMARALFESWFVRFEHPSTQAAAPRMIDSPLGPIPEGWSVGTLGDVAKERRDGVAADEMDGSMNYIALEHMPRRSITLTDWSNAENVVSNKLRFRRGDVLFGKLRPYFHKVGVAPVDGVCSTDIIVAQPVEPKWYGFVLSVMSSVDFVAHTDRGSAGTKMPRTNWKDMAAYRLAKPPAAIAAQFTTLIQPLVDRIISGIHEARTLSAMRDALLPKLISGELAVDHAEAALSEAKP